MSVSVQLVYTIVITAFDLVSKAASGVIHLVVDSSVAYKDPNSRQTETSITDTLIWWDQSVNQSIYLSTHDVDGQKNEQHSIITATNIISHFIDKLQCLKPTLSLQLNDIYNVY